MGETKISKRGLIAAVGLCLLATVGATFTNCLYMHQFDLGWLMLYGTSIVTLSGAVVDFDPKRLIK